MDFPAILSAFGDSQPQADGGYLAHCPAHSDTRPSLRIWRGDNGTVRITCRAGCDSGAVVAAAGLTWPDMFNATGDGATVSATPPKLIGHATAGALAAYVDQAAAALWSWDLPGADKARTYLADRFGLDQDAAAQLELGFSANLHAPFLSRAFTGYPRLVVPLRSFDGMPLGMQGRDLSGKCPGRWVGPMNPPGERWGAYGYFPGSGGYGAVIITEGPSDALTVVAVGYDALAVRGAALAGSPELVAELAAGLRGRQVIVAGDSDAAGAGFTERLTAGLSAHDIDVYRLDVPAPDINEWRQGDPEGFAPALHRAVQKARTPRAAADLAESRELRVRTGADSVSVDDGQEAARILAGLIKRYGESDAMHAYALVAWTNGRIRFAPGLGFYVWDGTVWVQSAVRVRQEIHRMGAALVLSGATNEARGFTKTANIDALMKELKSVPSVYVSTEEFDARPDLLSFRNGVVNLRTGQLRPHDPADMLTTTIPYDYDAGAVCPRWEQFLTEIMPGMPDMPAYLRRLVGYGITGHTSEQCFSVLWGKGANGKSVFAETLAGIFGSITRTTPFATFESKNGSGGIPNDIAALRGSRLVMASEGESGRPMSEAVLKRLTGKDRVTARFLNKEFFTYSPTFLILLATNHKPSFRSQDEGLWRRVKLIPFQRYFSPAERDYHLDRKLMAEAPGIIAWAVRGAVEWYADGLNDPAEVRGATREYRETSDVLAGFIPEVLRVTGEPATTLDGSEAFAAYRDWCEAEGLSQREVWSRKAFYQALSERGIERKRTNRGQALIGVTLTAPVPAGSGIFA